MTRSRFKTFKEAVLTSALMVSMLFLVEVADLILRREKGLTFAGFGIVPRTVPGLVGIVFSPLYWIHARGTRARAYRRIYVARTPL